MRFIQDHTAIKYLTQGSCYLLITFFGRRKFSLNKILKEKKEKKGSSRRGEAETNPTRNHEGCVFDHGLSQWVKDPALR